MDKMKLFAGIIVFGSLWGFSECIIGSSLNEAGLPTGPIMSGFFAITFLVISRMTYKQPGMQLGMGLVTSGFLTRNLHMDNSSFSLIKYILYFCLTKYFI